MSDRDLTERLMSAYQFAAQRLGDSVALADVRLHLATVGPHQLDPLLRQLKGTVVAFWSYDGAQGHEGTLYLLEPGVKVPWREIEGGVEIDNVLFTHMVVQSRA